MKGLAIRGVPRASVALAALVTALFLLAGPAPDLLVFDRQAIAEGQAWRLVTGHLTHSDGSHLAMNLLGLGLLGVLFERHSPNWGLLFGISAGVIDASLWLFQPGLEKYCGLSGVLYGLLAAGLVACWHENRARWILSIVALAGAAKLLLEIGDAQLLDHTAWPPLPASHLAGAAAGLAVAFMKVRS